MDFKNKPLSEIRAAVQPTKGDYVGAAHYNRLPDHLQPAEVAHAWGLDFLLWNTIKYISRAGHKVTATMSANEKEIDDLKKSIDYIQMRINVLEGRTPLSFAKETVVDEHLEGVPTEEEVIEYYQGLAEREREETVGWLEEPIESFMERWNVDTVTSAAKLKEKYGTTHSWFKGNPNKSDKVMKECWGDEGTRAKEDFYE